MPSALNSNGISNNEYRTPNVEIFPSLDFDIRYSSVRYSIFIFFFILCGLTAYAQPDDEQLDGEEVDVTKTFKARVAEAKKYSTYPTLPESTDDGSRESEYSLPTKLLDLEYEAPLIKPIAMRRLPADPVYQFWSKLGYGTPNHAYADLRLNNGQSDKIDFNLNVKHHSANRTKQLRHQRFGDTDAYVDGTFYSNAGFDIGAKLGIDVDQHHFFGHVDSVDFEKEDVFQRFITTYGDFHFKNTKETQGALNYWVNGDFHVTRDRYEGQENRFGFDLGLRKWINENHWLEVAIADHYRFYNDSFTVNSRQSNNLLEIQPHFVLNTGKFKLKAGAYLGYDGEFTPYPDIEASYALLEGKATVFAGWNGDIQQAQFREFGNYNPFIKSVLTLKNSRLQNRYLGVKGRFGKFNYEVRGTQKPIKNLAMYLTDYSMDTRQFDIVYDSISNQFTVDGVLDFEVMKDLQAVVSGGYTVYAKKKDDPHWHLPTLESNLGLHYSPGDKLRLNAEMYFASGAPYLTEEGLKENLSALFDLNAGASYSINKNFSLFLDLNNVLSSKYQRWYRYPQLGFNFLGGVKLKF